MQQHNRPVQIDDEVLHVRQSILQLIHGKKYLHLLTDPNEDSFYEAALELMEVIDAIGNEY